jgi:ABC-type nitrate/sulfonate/bicarbonate transport system substrate-binding protein
MNTPSIVALMLFCAVFSFGYQPARAAAPLAKVIMTTGSVSEREGAVYVAQEHGFFRKYGVDVSFVQVRNGPVGLVQAGHGLRFRPGTWFTLLFT